MMRKLKSIRLDLGMSQEDMAKKLNINICTYQKKEQGVSPLLARELRTISLMSKVPEEEIEIPC